MQTAPCYTVRVERVDEPQLPPGAAEAEALLRSVRQNIDKLSQAGKLQSPELLMVVPASRIRGGSPTWSRRT